MTRAPSPRSRRWISLTVCLILATAGAGRPADPGASANAVTVDAGLVMSAAPGWTWPVAGGFRFAAGYVAPPHPYGAGHRGIDLVPTGAALIVAPADGVVAYAGRVADRPVVTIAHADDVVTTFEPVESALPAGTPIRRGDVLGTLAAGGHAPPGALHVGARIAGDYLNPLALWGEIPRAVLLPCC